MAFVRPGVALAYAANCHGLDWHERARRSICWIIATDTNPDALACPPVQGDSPPLPHRACGKGGDVLHYVIFSKEEVGCIVYECKHTDSHLTRLVAQMSLAKKTREANYGILVTTGTRKGFSGSKSNLPRKSRHDG